MIGLWFEFKRVMTGRAERGRARSSRPSVEALDRRDLPAVIAPSVALDAISTSDSKSLTLEYEVSGGDLDQPFQLTVYRSADAQLDPGDAGVQEIQVGGAGFPVLDDLGSPVLAEGTHRLTVPLPEGLNIRPERPYVLAASQTPSERAGGEPSGEDPSVVSLRKYTIGVMTHGGFQSKSDKQGAPWALKMARSLQDLGYDAVIPYNWVAESRTAGAAAKQGPRVARLIELEANKAPEGEPVDVHFIGHSEGAVVNSVAMRALELENPARLSNGYIKATLLDPHAANNNAPGGRQYSVSKGFLGTIARWVVDGYQDKAKDPLPVIWGNVDEADVFYQRNPMSRTFGSNGGLYNLWGQVPVPVRGDIPVHYHNLTGVGISHSGQVNVVDWYRATVLPTLGDDLPYVDPTALRGGPATGTDAPVSSEPEFQGDAAPGTSVRIRALPKSGADAVVLGGTTADQNGQWSLTSRPLPAGTYRVWAKGLARAHPLTPRVLIMPSADLGQITVTQTPANRTPRGPRAQS